MTQWVMYLLYLLHLNTQNPHKADITIHVCNPSVPTVVCEAKTGESPEAGEQVSLHATREILLQSERQGPMLEDLL